MEVAVIAFPTDVQRLIRDAFRDACYASSVEELCKIRLVCVRLAATFYKRCIMLTMLKRYAPFRFPIYRPPPHAPFYYDLFQDFRSPVKMLPKCRLDPRDSNDFYTGYGHDMRSAAEPQGGATAWYYRLGVLRLQLMTIDPAYHVEHPPTEEEHERAVRDHLHAQEVKLFSFAPRPPNDARIEHMNHDAGENPFYKREWPWI